MNRAPKNTRSSRAAALTRAHSTSAPSASDLSYSSNQSELLSSPANNLHTIDARTTLPCMNHMGHPDRFFDNHLRSAADQAAAFRTHPHPVRRS